MSSIFYIDGEYVPSTDASIPADDLAVLRGYGVFDFMRTYNGKPFHLDAHLKRLENSARLIELDLPNSLDDIRRITLETIARNGYPESNVRIVVTGGTSPDNITPNGGARLLVMVTPHKPLPEAWYRDGVKIITNRTERYLPEAKTINYIPAIVALKKARKQNAVDAIYVDKTDSVLEGTTTNLFAFLGDRLITPGKAVLLGITRQAVLELASDRFAVEVSDLKLDDLMRADEVFITASNKEICPVRQVDDQIIGQGVPGPKTRFLMERFAHLTAAYGNM
ncbi:MAG: branched-chain amino acid aminotransferase [Anaerolineaceae bacterium]|nr:branched-chain amino acid aminotransferase [Anaerolineaceae bacterium]